MDSNNQPAVQQPTPQASVTPPASVAPEPVNNKKTSKFSIIIIAVLMLLIGLLGGYIISNKYQSMQYGSQNTNSYITPTIEVSSTVNPTSSVPADWKTYENTYLGISFKYPSDWRIADPYNGNYLGDPGAAKNYVGLIPANKEQGGSITPIYLERLDNPKNLSLEAYQDEINKTANIEQHYYTKAQVITSVDGYTAYYDVGCGEPFICDTVTIMAKNNIFIFNNVYLDKGDDVYPVSERITKQDLQAYKIIFNQIVSTIKFTNK